MTPTHSAPGSPPSTSLPANGGVLLREDLEALTYDLVGEKKVWLILKELLMIKLGRSPDRGDALCHSIYSW